MKYSPWKKSPSFRKRKEYNNTTAGFALQCQQLGVHTTPVNDTSEEAKRKEIRPTIADEEFNIITAKNAPVPDFDVLTQEEIAKLSKKKSKEYNNKTAVFALHSQLWENNVSLRKRILNDPESKQKEQERYLYERKLFSDYRKRIRTTQTPLELSPNDWNFPSVAAKPDDMDRELIKNQHDSEEFRKCSAQRYENWAEANSFEKSYRRYIINTLKSDADRRALYEENDKVTLDALTYTYTLESIRVLPLTRDVVARRGTSGYAELAEMLGLKVTSNNYL